ncbi:MAG: 16S rRNA (guanine(966)-N(2))-methyltransferase RsmD [Bacteroidetes bacterium]|nr:16S rRNA (guanine(966)-N(2))-methyltransferase RsmD [Bacteroidota bacterium]
MRVISGIHKGRKLFCVKSLKVRPATDKVKSSIFNSLQHRIFLDNANVLDLFAGCGSLGIEALSRGAKFVTFVEEDSEICESIIKNINLIKDEYKTKLLQSSVEYFLKNNNSEYNLVFADPPYEYQLTRNLPGIICDKILSKNGYLLIEHITSLEFPKSDLYNVEIQKRFGRTTVTYFTKKI